MEQSINDFKYRTLETSPRQQFRLVRLEPGPLSSLLNCSLAYYFLDDTPPFEGLSYVWGDSKDVLSIWLDSSQFLVTRNLESALRHLRLEDVARTFWIDAICINQKDLEERGMQVRIMREIYRAASRVLVWLGPGTERSDLAFQHMIERRELDWFMKLFEEYEALQLRQISVSNNIIELSLAINASRSGESSGQKDSALLQERIELEADLAVLCTAGQTIVQELQISDTRMLEVHQELENERPSHVQTSQTIKDTLPQWNTKDGYLWPLPELELKTPQITTEDPNYRNRIPSSITGFENEIFGQMSSDFQDTRIPNLNYLSAIVPENIDDGLDDILEGNVWWQRVWVIQEIAMAKDVIFQCGKVSAHWTKIFSVIVHPPTEYVPEGYPLILNILRLCCMNNSAIQQSSTSKMNLIDLLQRFRRCKATDPRDMVYALLGLASDVKIEDFFIDYNLDSADVYKYVVTFCIGRYQSLDILGNVLDVYGDCLHNLPSWCPDWWGESDCSPFPFRRIVQGSVVSFYSASGVLFPSMAPHNKEELALEGYVFDNIYKVYEGDDDALERLSPGKLKGNIQKSTALQKWEEAAQEFCADGGPYVDVVGAFWRTQIADAIGDQRAPESAAAMFNVWSGRSVAPDGDDFFTEPYENAVYKASYVRKFCLSDKKYMLLAPKNTQRGDLICVLFGGQTPFVIRKGAGYFSLIGSCYVHGIMDGESVEGLQTGEYQRHNFVLR